MLALAATLVLSACGGAPGPDQGAPRATGPADGGPGLPDQLPSDGGPERLPELRAPDGGPGLREALAPDGGPALPLAGAGSAAAPSPASGATPGAGPAGAGRSPLPLSAARALPPGGGRPVAMSPDAEATVDPGASFEVVVPARLVEARLLLLDGQDAVVPAEGSTEAGSETRLTLSPAQPLRPGTGYRLRLEGLARREVRDALGRAHEPLDLRVRTSGAPPPRRRQGPPRR